MGNLIENKGIEYATSKSSASVFFEAHKADFIAGYKKALEDTKIEELLEQFHTLAMICLQSERYRDDFSFRVELDKSFSLIKSATELNP